MVQLDNILQQLDFAYILLWEFFLNYFKVDYYIQNLHILLLVRELLYGDLQILNDIHN